MAAPQAADPRPDSLQEAVDWTPGLGRRAAFLGWSLFVLALAFFGATFLVALLYLQLD
jgi:hypothetical protein